MGKPFVSARITGHKELEQALDALGRTAGKRAITAAARRVLKPVVKDAKRMAPRGDGGKNRKPLHRTIRVATKLNSSQMRGRARADGARVFIGSTDPKAHLVEFGHVLVKGRKGNRRVIGHVPGHPFLRPAWDKHKGDLTQKLGEEIWKEVVKVANRWARQARAGKLGRTAKRVLSR